MITSMIWKQQVKVHIILKRCVVTKINWECLKTAKSRLVQSFNSTQALPLGSKKSRVHLSNIIILWFHMPYSNHLCSPQSVTCVYTHDYLKNHTRSVPLYIVINIAVYGSDSNQRAQRADMLWAARQVGRHAHDQKTFSLVTETIITLLKLKLLWHLM
jgi:hypothetical protein